MSERVTVHLNDWDRGLGRLWGPSDLSLERLRGRTIVANGCFDGLHPGHLALLASLDTIAYQMGLRPIVALNSDDSVRRIKGSNRPIWPQTVRSILINNLKWPLTVVIFDEDTPERLMELLEPAVVLKGSEYRGRPVIAPAGSQIVFADMVADWSTSRIVGDTR